MTGLPLPSWLQLVAALAPIQNVEGWWAPGAAILLRRSEPSHRRNCSLTVTYGVDLGILFFLRVICSSFSSAIQLVLMRKNNFLCPHKLGVSDGFSQRHWRSGELSGAGAASFQGGGEGAGETPPAALST